MPEHEARARAVYDHTDDEPRRRRQVADWGVGEELFDHMPRRRFGRERGDRHEEIPRGGAEDGRRTIVIGDEEDALPPVREEPAEEEFASREEALRAREEDDALWGGAEPFVRGPQGGRRTVRIGGRPGEIQPDRPRRPPKTVGERVGPRPDRVAAWAFALGVLLILIAVLS